MSKATYTLGVVCQDMAPAEALYQAFDNLAHLNDVVNDVFSRLTTRIAAERAKVSQVVKRVQEAQIKATRISENQTKVTTIHSPAKYPAPKQLNDFQRVFDGQFEESRLSAPRRSEYNLTAKQRRAEAQGVDTSEIFASLSKARATRQDPDRRVAEAGVGAEGLGRLPAYLPSVSSVLLFNSDENPYKKYVSFNNLEGTGGTDRQQQQTGLAAAPKTIFEGTGLPTFAALQYEYKPDLGQVPTFALPQNLPLGKLADISFGADGVASIAPSIAQLPSLPTIESFQKSAATPAKKQAAPNPSQPPAQPSSIPIAPAAAAVAPPLAPPMHGNC